MQAQSALGRHGRIMGGTLMIGVVPCQGDNNLNTTHNNSNILDQRSSVGRLDNSNIANISSSLGNTTNKSIRPLTQAYKAAQSEHEVFFNLYLLMTNQISTLLIILRVITWH